MNGWKKQLLDNAAVIMAILVQSGVLVWWAATLTVRMDYVERDLQACSKRIDRLETSKRPY